MNKPARAGRYRLEEVLGVGSFATVYRAVDDRLDADVVVKILAENHSLNPEIRERFIAEGRSLRRVENPHVVSVHDIGESERQQPYLVLEYADRGTLAQRVHSLRSYGWRASAADVIAVARSLTSALSAVHAAGLVHRDLSPGNVLIKTRPEAATGQASTPQLLAAEEMLVVADLGMCKDLALNSGLTVAGGTAGFRPPEQEVSPSVIDQRADLWAMSQLLKWITQDADLPRAFYKELERGLAPDPNKRHQDAQSWLSQIEKSLEPPAPPVAPTPAEVQKKETRKRRTVRRVVVALALAAAFMAGLFAAGLFDGGANADGVVAIEGPATIGVGEPATYRVVTESDGWVWILPDGRFVADEREVTLTPTSAGSAELVIQARDEGGNVVAVSKKVTVQ